MSENRRTATRHAVSIPGTLAVDNQESGITVLNLSLGGALVSATTRHAMGQRVQIKFLVPTSEDAIEVGATVRWAAPDSVGLQFDGLRARDVWALNEYFKRIPG